MANARSTGASPRRSRAVAPGDFVAPFERVVAIIGEVRSCVVRTVNSEVVPSYWHISREMVEYVQRGEMRTEYGDPVIEDLFAQLRPKRAWLSKRREK